VQKSKAGLQRVVFAEDAIGLEVTLHQGAPRFETPLGPGLVARVASALRLPRTALRYDLPVQIVSTGHSKVLVPLSLSDAELDQLTPDMGALAELSGTLGCNGYFVFRLGPDARRSDGRMFAPAIGIEEDPVTGNANGPLGAYLALHGVLAGSGEVELDGHQGRAIGRPGRVRVRVQLDRSGAPQQVSIAGRAVLIAQGDLACC
jgi:PhzF family phenazine biosynthesis protein